MAREHPARRGAFYGRRKRHALKPRQAAIFASLLPRLALDLTRPAPADLATLFPHAPEVINIEIGFGSGEHMIAQAERRPDVGIIGVEPFLNGMAKALAGIAARNLVNIRLHFGDAVFLLEWLPPRSIARLDLLYPDPWPKRRHWKRRFVRAETIAAIARILRPGGELRFVSDWSDYVAWTLAHLMRSAHFDWAAECADDWQTPWPEFTATRYGTKAKQQGRVSSYLIFRRRMTEDG